MNETMSSHPSSDASPAERQLARRHVAPRQGVKSAPGTGAVAANGETDGPV